MLTSISSGSSSSHLLFTNIKIKIFKVWTILPGVLYRYETCSVTLKVFENGEFYNFDSSPDIIRMIKSMRIILVGHVGCMGKMGNAYITLVRIDEGTKSKKGR
jgi:hypothetical protein